MTARATRLAALALVLTACSSDTSPPDPSGAMSPSGTPSAASTTSASPTETPSPTEATSSAAAPEPAPYLPVPQGVELTAQGDDLRLGERATVAWEPRRAFVGAIEVTVTGVARTTLKDFAAFRLDPTQRRSTPYYVRATVRNVGRTNLGGVAVPLYAVNRADTLIQATPAPAYTPCRSAPFPRPFAAGDRARVCLVYLVPMKGTLKAVSFRPSQEYDPITWTGKVAPPAN